MPSVEVLIFEAFMQDFPRRPRLIPAREICFGADTVKLAFLSTYVSPKDDGTFLVQLACLSPSPPPLEGWSHVLSSSFHYTAPEAELLFQKAGFESVFFLW